MGPCVYDCRHPLWEGGGTCFQGADDSDYRCSCDDGFGSTDSLGRPSCVPKFTLAAVHILVAVTGAATLMFMQYSAVKQRRLSTATNTSRRARCRLRLIHHSSLYSGSAFVVFSVAALHGSLCKYGMLELLCTVTMPSSTLCAASVIDLWLDALPKQLMPANSMALEMITLLEKKDALLWVGRAAFLSQVLPGFLTFFMLDTIKILWACTMAAATAGAFIESSFFFVGFHLTGVIGNARRQVFYERALRNLWAQVAALGSVGVIWMGSGLALQPMLTEIASSTPIIPLSTMVVDGFVGVTLVVHFARIGGERGGSSSGLISQMHSPPQNTSVVLSPHTQRLKASFFAARVWAWAFKDESWDPDNITTSIPTSAVCRANSAGKRVLPTVGEVF